MPLSLARKGILAAAAVVLVLVAVVAVLPVIASTQIVRDGIAYQMSAWSGYRVRLDDSPEIRVWPSFQAVLHDVTLSDWNQSNPQPVLEAERIDIDLSAVAALRGEIVFTKMHLIRPVLRMQGDATSPYLPPPQDWGRLSRSIASARAVVDAAPTDPDKAALPTDAVGEIRFEDGLVTTRTGESRREVLTGLTGRLNWPALNRPATVTAQAIWHGEQVSVEAQSQEPLLLLGGGTAPVTLALEAPAAKLAFDGIASIAGENFAEGDVDFSAPSLNQFLEWAQAFSLPVRQTGPVTLAAHVSGNMSRLEFGEATLGFEESTGHGLLEVSFGSGRPSVAGTLAFDSLDLQTLMSAFNPAPPTDPTALPVSSGNYSLDLRLSAETADFGSAALADVAASAKVTDGLSTFDISDATAFGGMVQFGMRTEGDGQDQTVAFRMHGENVDTGALADALAIKQLLPRAKSNFSAQIKGKGQNLNSVLRTAEGTVSASFGNGTIPGLDLNRFLELGKEGSFVSLNALSAGELSIEGAEISATLSSGIARIDKAEIASGQYRIGLEGLVPVAGRGLALYGSLTPLENAQEIQSRLMFFVGGSWSDPFISLFGRDKAQ